MIHGIEHEVFEVRLTGSVYGSPTTQTGSVAPTGHTGTFACRGTIVEIGAAWQQWCNQPVVSLRGNHYPRRWLHSAVPLHPRDTIVTELQRRHGGGWGNWVGPVSRLLRGEVVS